MLLYLFFLFLIHILAFLSISHVGAHQWIYPSFWLVISIAYSNLWFTTV
jgi:hypothetical protein